jgi:uncharacterized protein (UPF0264 family)
LEGSLGGQYPWVIREVRKITPPGIEISAAICDSLEKPGLITQALLGVLTLEVDYAKIGLYKPASERSVREFLKRLCKVKSEFKLYGRIVAAGYADWSRIGSVNPMRLPDLAEGLEISVLMIDTLIKDGKSTFDYMSMGELEDFVEKCRSKGFRTALAGGIRLEHLPYIKKIGCDIIGVRSLVCENGDRVKGGINPDKIRELKRILS